MAGSVDLIQRCYLGVEMRAAVLHFDADHDALRISSGSFTTVPITIPYRGHYRNLAPGERCQFRLLKPDERDRDENRVRRRARTYELLSPALRATPSPVQPGTGQGSW